MADSGLISTNSFKAFSGANIHATIGNRLVGTLQAVTVSITREVAALYSFADANPKAFVKGKRGIAGTLVFTQFDRHALLEGIFFDIFNKPLNSNPSLFTTQFLDVNSQNGLFSGEAVKTQNFDAGQVNASLATLGIDQGSSLQNQITEVYKLVGEQRFRYSDQIPEFDLTLNLVNESGDAAFCVIGGVVLVNEGWGYTLDDMTSEVAFTYVARYVTPLTPVTNTGNIPGINPGPVMTKI
jgi:hypothetical protein